jgi:hypothetical protein
MGFFMPFIARNDASKAYDNFVSLGLPENGKDFESALVRILFKEMHCGQQLPILFLDHREYLSYKTYAT